MGSLGYIDHGGLPHGVQMDDMGCSGGYPLWKPPGNYFPRGEAPPPYEEAVAAARAEQALLTISSHALSPLNLPNPYLTSHTSHSSMALVAGTQNNLTTNSPTPSNYNAASPSSSISSANRPLNPANSHSTTCHQQLNQGEENPSAGFYTTSTMTNFSMATNIYENAAPVPVSVTSGLTPEHASILSSNNSENYQDTMRHNALSRQSSAFTISATLPSSSSISTHRTIPRTLATSSNLRLRRDFLNPPVVPLFDPLTKDKSSERSPRYVPPPFISNENAGQSAGFYDETSTPSSKTEATDTDVAAAATVAPATAVAAIASGVDKTVS